jgi:hypothetical protein
VTLPQINYALEWGATEFVAVLKAEVRDQISREEELEAEMEEIFGE